MEDRYGIELCTVVNIVLCSNDEHFGRRRAYLPVDTKQVVYSHFQYVSGVPRTKDQNGVSIGKLKILNTLIDQLVKMRENERSNKLLTAQPDEKRWMQ